MKKFFSTVLSILILLSVLPITGMADSPQENDYTFSYHQVDFEVDRPDKSASDVHSGGIPALKATSIPSSYSSVSNGKVTNAKNQNPYGSCWAFSATSVAESSLISNGGPAYDLSELQLVNYFYHEKIDPLGNANGDSTKNLESTPLQLGGNHIYTLWALANWSNATTESVLPYTTSNCNAVENGTLSDKYANSYDVAHLQNAYIIPYDMNSSDDAENIKAAIMKYGSVACAYYHDSSCYNSAHSSYYTTQTGINHAVTIVGWNDNYSKENFNSSQQYISILGISIPIGKSKKPERNGAWLVKNSWGTNWGTDGDSDPAHKKAEGYFWLSYCDASLDSSGQVYVFDYESTDKYQYNYQYDGSCGTYTLNIANGKKVAAMYDIKGLTADKERIDAVGIGLASADVSGEVSIYTDPIDGNPCSGNLVARQSFYTTYVGFHTIEINNAPTLKKGQSYSVVFEFDSDVSVFVDYSYNGEWILFTADTANDKTYTVTSSKVNDLKNSNCTARIKAYTNDYVQTYDINFNANGGSDAPSNITKIEGTSVTLPTKEPTRAGYTFIGWATDPNADKPDYKSGDTYTNDESVTLYAVWEAKVATSFIISDPVLDLNVGEEPKTVTITPNPLDAICDWTVKDATKSGDTFTVNGIEITRYGNTFDMSATQYSDTPYEVVFHDNVSNKDVSCLVTFRKMAEEILIDPETLTLTVGGEAKTVTLSTNPSDANFDWFVSNAGQEGLVYYYGGLEITQNESTFSIRATEWVCDTLYVYFYDFISFNCVTCKVCVEPRIATSANLSSTSLDLTVGDESQTVTVSHLLQDAVCDWYVKDAEKYGDIFTKDGLEIIKDGDSFSLSAFTKTADTVTVTFVDSRSKIELSLTVNVTIIYDANDLVVLKSILLLSSDDPNKDDDVYNTNYDVNLDGVINILDIVCMKRCIADNADYSKDEKQNNTENPPDYPAETEDRKEPENNYL